MPESGSDTEKDVRRPDDVLHVYIKDALLWSPDVAPENIEIFVENGRAALDGTVSTYWEKVAAEEAAARVAGVQAVVNRLVVVPTERVLDKTIAENIVSALDAHPEISPESIDVSVSDGTVTLSGSLPTRRLYDVAMDASRYTTGVVNIEDKIAVG